MRQPVAFQSITLDTGSQPREVRRLAVSTAWKIREFSSTDDVRSVCQILGILMRYESQYRDIVYLVPPGNRWRLVCSIYDQWGEVRPEGIMKWLIAHELGHTFHVPNNLRCVGDYPNEYFCDIFATAFHFPPRLATRDLTKGQVDFSSVDPSFPSLSLPYYLGKITQLPGFLLSWALRGYPQEEWNKEIRKKVCAL